MSNIIPHNSKSHISRRWWVFELARSRKANVADVEVLPFPISNSNSRATNQLNLNGTQPVGKQRNEPEGYWYTPCSGIWQTVWLEPVDVFAATGVKLIPHVRGPGWL